MESVDERLLEPAKAEEFRCAICTEISLQIVETAQCGHLFCETCLIAHLATRNNCPTCRMPLGHPGYRPIEYLRRQVSNLRVYCAKRRRSDSKDGCDGVYLLREESTHKKVCLWADAQCSCGALMPRHSLMDHSKLVCPKRSVDCHWCAWRGEAVQRNAHEAVCPRRPVHCRFCQREEEQQGLSRHEELCDSRLLPCPVCKVEMRQGDFEQHMREQPGHIRALCNEVHRMRGFLEEHKMLKTYLHPPFSLFVENQGSLLSVLVHSTDTVAEVRQKLPEACRLQPLLWRGKFLKDHFSLDVYSLVTSNVAQPIQIVR